MRDGVIYSIDGATLDEKSMSFFMLVEPGTKTVSLSGKVKISDNTSWKLYRGETEIATKVAASVDGSLIDGDNPFYIVTTTGLIERTYELNIYRSFYAKITYMFGGNQIGMDEAATGYEFSLPEAFDIQGYTFSHWTDSEAATVTSTIPWGDVSFFAVASANSYTLTLDPAGGNLSENSVTVTYNKEYFLPTPTRRGYEFWGWYDDGYFIASRGIWTVPFELNLTAHWRATPYSVTYDLNGGTNASSNPTTYTVEDHIVFVPATKPGYTFLGWFDEQGNEVVSIEPGTIGEINLIARWNEGNIYVVSFDPNGGEVSVASMDVQYDREYTLPVPIRRGYEFVGWYDDASVFPQSGTWGATSAKSLTAHWSAIVYTISYDLNGGTNASSNPTTYTVEDHIVFAPATKPGYTFLGWFDAQNDVISEIEVGTIGDLSLNALWNAVKNKLEVSSIDDSKGTVEVVSGEGYTGESVSVKATPCEELIFSGWFSDGSVVSFKQNYTFVMPSKDYSLVAYFSTKEEMGIEPAILSDYEVTYGLYPQTKITNQNTIAALNEINVKDEQGYVAYYGQKYYKYGSWYKVEPIWWTVLPSSESDLFLISKFALDYTGYIDSTTEFRYAASYIRRWLTNQFFSKAFHYGDSFIKTTEVDNSAESTGVNNNKYATDPTYDKVFLLSYAEASNPLYFYSSASRICYRSSEKQYTTSWWTRSPYTCAPTKTTFGYGARYVDHDGTFDYDDSGWADTKRGIRPALHLDLD